MNGGGKSFCGYREGVYLGRATCCSCFRGEVTSYVSYLADPREKPFLSPNEEEVQ